MAEPASVRVDSWAWAVRLYKTRSAASTATKAGHLRVNGDKAKPATPVRIGDEVRARVGDTERILIAKRLIVKRVGAVVAAECFDDLTPPPPPKVEAPSAVLRERGAGRPTKRDRRILDQLRGR
ncbi:MULTISPECIES: RNA-binding S4 domain-containing protein [unclassified Leifsonia]|uniref:RNA-binding S4 domain-containing protein n=1 Tax=unclassified Leifsonia TaxID=2663824 RepID=UPI001442CE2F|nr:S4 domain-containing protein [Leifsonia sp. PS1209]QIZ99115.1 RNA-binding S4 domain-containing protein [Leifsonia sp. PS1209]